MRETCVDLQSQGNYTLFRETMALPVQNINHSAFRSMFEKEKLSGNNFNDWFARLKLVLRVEKKMHVIEQPLPPAPEAGAEPNIVAQWTALYDAHTEIACLMLGSMTPELHRQFELHYPYDMIQELRSMFEKQAGVEKFDLIQSFHACKQEEGKSVADYVLKMKGYVEQLERLGYMLPQDISVGLILNGLTKDFVGFVRNYNMHNMGKTIGEIHAMLIEYEKGLPKKAETPQVMMIKSGKIQKANKKSLNAKGKNKAVRWRVFEPPQHHQEEDDSDRRTGYVFVLNGGAVDWKSSKQSTIAMSATESEYILHSEAVMELELPAKVNKARDTTLPLQPVAPPSPDYIPGPEDPQILPVPQDEDEREPMFIHAHDPDYVPEPIYPGYIPLEDDHEFPGEGTSAYVNSRGSKIGSSLLNFGRVLVKF
ncbi:hypothetical protein Tco_0497044 [Tanacetum coccineum]